MGNARAFGWLSRLLIHIACADKSLAERCPPRDLLYLHGLAWLILGAFVWQAMAFGVAAHVLFSPGGQVRVAFIAAAIGLAFYIMMIDRYIFIFPSWYYEGLQQLRRAGFAMAENRGMHINAGLALLVRILLLSVSLSALSAISVSLWFFRDEINARLQADYLAKNRTLIIDVTSRIDDGIKQASDLTRQHSDRVGVMAAQIQTLRQALIDPGGADRRVQAAEQDLRLLLERRSRVEDDLRGLETFAANEYAGIKGTDGNTGRPGSGRLYKSATQRVTTTRAKLREIEKEIALARTRVEETRKQTANAAEAVLQRAGDQLPAAEEALKAETTKLDAARQESDRRIAGRDQAVRNAVENALGQIGRASGLLARVAALHEIARESLINKLIVGLFELLSFILEIAAVLAKIFGRFPTSFAPLLVKEAYLADVRIAEEGLSEIDAIERQRGDKPGGDGNSDVSPPAPQSHEPPKRKRGRPRKHPPPDS